MDAKCKRTCDGKCEVLENLLRQEREALHRYETIIDMCDYPDVRAFLVELLGAREAFQSRIEAKIEELKIQSETAHDVMDSFESFS
jgi:bacterioferritin (cytochrome b1)